MDGAYHACTRVGTVYPVSSYSSHHHDDSFIPDWVSEGQIAMIRFAQVLYSVCRVIIARMVNSYDWKFEVARQCQELGGVYTKFLQILAVHNKTKYLVQGLGSDLAFEHVPYEDIDIDAELGPVASRLYDFEREPFAAGSYGQVYRGRLRENGAQVIVKILRPTVRRTLKTDLFLLKIIAAFVSPFARTSMLDIRRIVREFARATWAETNYIQEAQNGELLRSYFSKRGTILIPKSYVSLSTRTVLVQDYVGGVSIVSMIAKQQEGYRIDQLVSDTVGSDVWKQLCTLGIEMLRASIYADYVMVDPHPGNVRLLSDDRVALIDFGLVSPAPTNRSGFANIIHEFRNLFEDRFSPSDFTIAMLAFFDAELHDALELLARDEGDDYEDMLRGFVDRFVTSPTKKSRMQQYIADKQLLQLFDSVLNQGNKLGIHVNEENVLLQRSMTMALSVIRGISDAHVERVYDTLVRYSLAVVDDEIQAKGVSQSHTHRVMSEEQALEVASDWLSLIAERDRGLYKYIINRSYAS